MTNRKRVLGVVSFVLLVIGLAGIPTNIGRWGKAFAFIAHYMNLDTVRIVISVFGILLFAVVFLLPYLKPRLNIELIPSTGPSPEIVLRVLNHGSKRNFHAQCTLLALRNSPNKLYHGTFDLKWEHGFDRSVSIGREDFCNLMIAKMETDHRNRLAEMEILGLSGTQTKKFEWSRWSTDLKEKLPEYDFEITILSDEASNPISTRFTLRPKAWYGPLEMVRS